MAEHFLLTTIFHLMLILFNFTLCRPLYQILNEVNVETVPQQIQPKLQPLNRIPSYEDHRQLTPEEKYVVYLEEQLIQKQQQHQQKYPKIQKHQQPQFHQNPSVSPSPQVIVVSSTLAPLSDNHILYQQEKLEKVNYKKLIPVPVYQTNEYNHPQNDNHIQYPQSENQ